MGPDKSIPAYTAQTGVATIRYTFSSKHYYIVAANKPGKVWVIDHQGNLAKHLSDEAGALFIKKYCKDEDILHLKQLAKEGL